MSTCSGFSVRVLREHLSIGECASFPIDFEEGMWDLIILNPDYYLSFFAFKTFILFSSVSLLKQILHNTLSEANATGSNCCFHCIGYSKGVNAHTQIRRYVMKFCQFDKISTRTCIFDDLEIL